MLPYAEHTQTYHTWAHRWPLLWGSLRHSTVSMPGSWEALGCALCPRVVLGQSGSPGPGKTDQAGPYPQADARKVGNPTGSAACTQPPGLSAKIRLIGASFSRRCQWICGFRKGRGKAGQPHSPTHALVP